MVVQALLADTVPGLNATDVGLPNSTSNLGQILPLVAQFLITIIGFLAVIFIIVGGIQITTSAGDPARYKRGRQTLTYAVVGVVLAIASYGVVNYVVNNIH